MDKFVRDQLRRCQLGKDLTEELIKVFSENGIHEDKYKSLRLTQLLQLIPDDDDAIHSVFANVRSHSIKARTLDQVDLDVIKSEPADSDDNDVQIIKEVINTSRSRNGAFSINIKSEAPATPPPSPDGPDSSHDTLQNHNHHENVPEEARAGTAASGGEAEMDKEVATASRSTPTSAADRNESSKKRDEDIRTPTQARDENCTQPQPQRLGSCGNLVAQPEAMRATQPSDPEIEIDEVNINGRILRKRPGLGSGSSRLRQKRMAKSKSKHESTHPPKSRRAFLQSKFSDSFLEVYLIYDRQKVWKTYLRFSELVELEEFFQLLHSVPESGVGFPPIQGLEMQLSDKKIIIHEAQLLELTTLPTSFLSHLTYICLNFPWDETINPDTFTAFLGACASLKDLKLEHGIYGVSQRSISIQIPLLPYLKTFNWAGDYYVESVEYKCALPVVELDESRLSPQTFVIDFGENVYPRLKKLDLGLLVEMKFETLSQFPKLGEFYVSSSWNKFGFLRSTSDTIVGQQNLIDDIDIPPGVTEPKSMCMPLITGWFPNLSSLSISLPTVAGARSLVHHMADSKLRSLYMVVNFQFEAALTSAFLGIPFTTDITSDADHRRLDDLKQYAHWKSFAEYLKIDLPEEVDYEGENDAQTQSAFAEAKGIGSMKCLQSLTIRQMPKKVFLPLDDRHWGDPEVTLSQERWSAAELPFPERILLQELKKLKGKLEYVNLPYFQISVDAGRKFKRAMGFDLELTCDDYKSNVDCFPENVARAIGAAIKPEK